MLKKIALIILGCAVLNMGNSQLTVSEEDEGRIFLNTITTAVPFLLIAPDSRSGGIGDAGVALSADAAAIHWNPAKMAFAEDDFEVQLSYSPWLRALVNDMNLAYLSGYRKLNKTQAFGAGLRFFSLGTITFTSQDGSVIRDFKPSEFTVDAAFSQKLSDKFSGGIGARFINSNLTGGTTLEGGADTKPGRSVGVDVSIFYTNDDVELGKKDAIWNVGLTVSNIGAKMSYTSTQERDFIPANMRLGTALTTKLDTYNELTLTLDANKLLVPTPPIYDPEDETLIAAGMDPDVGVAQAMVQSFYDAP